MLLEPTRLLACFKLKISLEWKTVLRFCVNSPHAHHILANSKIMALYKNIRPPWIYSPVFTTNACWTTFQSTCLICFRNFWNGDQSQWHFLDGVWGRVTLAEMITHYFRIQQLGGIIAKAYAHTHKTNPHPLRNFIILSCSYTKFTILTWPSKLSYPQRLSGFRCGNAKSVTLWERRYFDLYLAMRSYLEPHKQYFLCIYDK